MPKIKAAHNLLLLIPLYIGFLTFSRGFYTQPSFIILLITFCLFTFIVFKNGYYQKAESLEKVTSSIFLIAFFQIIISFFLVRGFYQGNDIFLQINYTLISLSLVVFLTYAFQPNSLSKFLKHRFLLLMFFNVLIRIFLIAGSPNPNIDVYDSLKRAPQAILQHKNPYNYQYSQVYKDVKPLNYFPYPPGSLIFLTPVVFLLKDPRFLFVITETLTAYILYRLLEKNLQNSQISELIPITYLSFPLTFFILEQSWLDPLAGFLIALFAFLNRKYPKNHFISGVVLGITLLIKQYLLIIPLFFIRNFSKYAQKIIIGITTACLIVAFFYLMDPSKFNAYRLNYSYRFDSLSLTAYFFQNFRIVIPKTLIFATWIALAAFTIGKKPKAAYQNYTLLSYWLLGFFAASFVAFANEYYLSYQILLLAYALSYAKN